MRKRSSDRARLTWTHIDGVHGAQTAWHLCVRCIGQRRHI
jgi:hypothetical protein